MGVNSANSILRQARLNAGLTQAQMSEGICTQKVLSRIENGKTNVSHATFEALMKRAGASHNIVPVFSSREDFDCLYALKLARFHLDAWKLAPACEELQKLADRNWIGNPLYYQEWLLLHCKLQFRSYNCSHRRNHTALLNALHITRPGISLTDFRSLLLSQNELQLLTALAQETLYLGDMESCRQILDQVSIHLADSGLALMEKERLQAEETIVRVKYLIATNHYDTALEKAETQRHKMALNKNETSLLELTFLTGLCCYLTGDNTLAEKWIKATFYSAYAVGSCYATACRNYLREKTAFVITGQMDSRPDIPLVEYPLEEPASFPSLSANIYDGAGFYSLGSLIRDLRLEQGVSQDLLCRGLCNKSKLSKIENSCLMPDIMLTEALLQRLGKSERIFTFWGNPKDKKWNDLKPKLTHLHHVPEETLSAFVKEAEQLLEEKDILYRQEYLFLKTLKLCPPGERITGFLEALRLTIDHFDIAQLCSYRLTWCELSILNNLAMEYCLTSQVDLCFTYVSQIETYFEKVLPETQFQYNILPYTYVVHCRTLYRQKLFRQILALNEKINTVLLKFNISAYGSYLFFYSQALGECSFYDKAEKNAINSYAIDEIYEYIENSAALKRYFADDFSITLDY